MTASARNLSELAEPPLAADVSFWQVNTADASCGFGWMHWYGMHPFQID